MSIVRVKNKYQVVIPEHVRAVVGVEVGDTFEVKADRGKITFTPKSLVVVDREIAEGLLDVKRGRTYGPYATADATISALHKMVAQKRKERLSPKR